MLQGHRLFVYLVVRCLEQALTNRASVHDQLGENALSRLLSAPLSRYNVIKLLALDSYPKLMGLLRPKKRKDMVPLHCCDLVDLNFTGKKNCGSHLGR